MSRAMLNLVVAGSLMAWLGAGSKSVVAQPAPEQDVQKLQSQLAELRTAIDRLQQVAAAEDDLPDVVVYAKAVDWILRHQEFYGPDYVQQSYQALETGKRRATALPAQATGPDWNSTPGKKILGYRSEVDGSYQPYALALPAEFDRNSERRWPLHVVLHGRGAKLNEVNFIRQHDSQPPLPGADWIQLDVFGRTNNAYRFAGERDVFEALADVRRRYRIDDRRIVLHGFSMGGAGSWHLGLHYPALWCSVGPGAGFIDFYNYQKISDRLPAVQDKALSIYNATDYTLNAFNVPICTYGGEKDEQLVASTEMVRRAQELGIPIKLLIGPGVGHAFHPESLREFMAFHQDRQRIGRPVYPGNREIRFTTHTLKYNTCDWITIEEMIKPYEEARVEAVADEAGQILEIKTRNVAVLQVGRDLAERVRIDGAELDLASAAEGLLPGVHFELSGDNWIGLDYNQSLAFPKNEDRHKRHDLQGPIDDAFMSSFVCVRGTGRPWNDSHAAWSSWTLQRFAGEFDKWLRGQVRIVDDTEVSPEMVRDQNLILFGDPGENQVLQKVLSGLPIEWTRESLSVFGEQYNPETHGLALIYPNPLNPRRYVVLNSGHTFHAEDFQKSNAWLFPRLGDIAIQRFEKLPSGGYQEQVLKADIFDSYWKLPGQRR